MQNIKKGLSRRSSLSTGNKVFIIVGKETEEENFLLSLFLFSSPFIFFAFLFSLFFIRFPSTRLSVAMESKFKIIILYIKLTIFVDKLVREC